MNPIDQKIKNLVDSFGAISETLFIFNKSLTTAGFTTGQALELTKTYLATMTAPIFNNAVRNVRQESEDE